MSITSEIATIVNNKFPDATYTLSSWMKANLESYDLETMTLAEPFIILNNELPKDKEVQQNSNILSNTDLTMWFLVKGDDSVYTTDTDMNAAIESLEAMADQIFMQILLLSQTRLKGTELQGWRVTPKFKIFNSVLVGVEARGRFKENQVINMCPTP